MSKKDIEKTTSEEEKNTSTVQQEKEEQKKEASLEEKLQEEIAQEKDKFLRLFAEFENYKKRTAKERLDLFKTANSEVLEALLPVLDDFDRGWSEISKSEDKALTEGVKLIHDKLNTILKSKGLEVVNLKKGDTFDADFAEAAAQIPVPEKKLKGKIVDVIEKGYKLGDKIIRYPKVVIGQ